jgi:hypothetical protein
MWPMCGRVRAFILNLIPCVQVWARARARGIGWGARARVRARVGARACAHLGGREGVWARARARIARAWRAGRLVEAVREAAGGLLGQRVEPAAVRHRGSRGVRAE